MEVLKKLRVDVITPDPNQPRKTFELKELRELSQSLKSIGESQPILVRPFEEQYMIIMGERRWRAAKLVGIPEVLCRIRDNLTSDQVTLLQFTDYHMERLPWQEEARAWQAYIEKHDGMKQKTFADLIGVHEEVVGQRLRGLEAVGKTNLVGFSARQARQLAAVPEERQVETVEVLKDNSISSTTKEKLPAAIKEATKKCPAKPVRTIAREVEASLRESPKVASDTPSKVKKELSVTDRINRCIDSGNTLIRDIVIMIEENSATTAPQFYLLNLDLMLVDLEEKIKMFREANATKV